ncbi:MAG: DHH family phosphoesterase [Elusimicrobiota bacterium]
MSIPLWIKNLDKVSTGENHLLIIHHWDTDGICSAAIFKQFIRESAGNLDIDCIVPVMGTYELKPDNFFKNGNIHIPEDKKYGVIVILDYSVPARDIINLKDKYGVPVIVYDHHLREPVESKRVSYNNPVGQGEPGENWPSCTWVLKEKLNRDMSDLVLLGIAGDLEERFAPEGFQKFPEVREYLKKTGNRYKDYVKAKDFIDIHYKENDREMLKKISEEVLKLNGNPDKIMAQDDWRKKQDDHLKYLNELVQRAPDDNIDKILEIHRVDSSKNIISTLTRRLAAKTDYKYVMVINTGFFDNRTQIYVRRNSNLKKGDTKFFKQAANSLEGQAGGKTEVAGIILPDEKLSRFINKVKAHYE